MGGMSALPIQAILHCAFGGPVQPQLEGRMRANAASSSRARTPPAHKRFARAAQAVRLEGGGAGVTLVRQVAASVTSYPTHHSGGVIRHRLPHG